MVLARHRLQARSTSNRLVGANDWCKPFANWNESSPENMLRAKPQRVGCSLQRVQQIRNIQCYTIKDTKLLQLAELSRQTSSKKPEQFKKGPCNSRNAPSGLASSGGPSKAGPPKAAPLRVAAAKCAAIMIAQSRVPVIRDVPPKAAPSKGKVGPSPTASPLKGKVGPPVVAPSKGKVGPPTTPSKGKVGPPTTMLSTGKVGPPSTTPPKGKVGSPATTPPKGKVGQPKVAPSKGKVGPPLITPPKVGCSKVALSKTGPATDGSPWAGPTNRGPTRSVAPPPPEPPSPTVNMTPEPEMPLTVVDEYELFCTQMYPYVQTWFQIDDYGTLTLTGPDLPPCVPK